MGSRKLDLSSAPIDYDRTLERFFGTAFGPSPALYRQISLCGWRPLFDCRKHDNRVTANQNRTPKTSPGIEVYETDAGMTIEVALSAIREESLHLAVTGHKVIIRGERIVSGKPSAFPVTHGRKPQFQHLIPLPATIRTGVFRAQLDGDIVRIDFEKYSL